MGGRGGIFHLKTDGSAFQLPLLPFKAALYQRRNYKFGRSQRMQYQYVLQMHDSLHTWVAQATHEAAPLHLGLRCLLTGFLCSWWLVRLRIQANNQPRAPNAEVA